MTETIYKWIAVANRCTRMYLDKRFEPYGINASHYMFIVHICRCPGITQDKLPDLIHVNKSSVTRALIQLEKAGFITRTINAGDKRTALVHPTAKSERLYPALMRIIAEWDAILTRGLAAPEKDQLAALLRKTAETAAAFLAESGRR